MNLELLKKLVRLANNNPNEHEANLAARRACKLIEDGKFEFKEKTEKEQRFPSQYGVRSDRYSYSGMDFSEFVRKWAKDVSENIYEDSFWEQSGINSNIKRKIKCKKCGEVKETRFRGLADNWICMECRGKEYQNK